jgi:cytoskeletal protein RodZ
MPEEQKEHHEEVRENYYKKNPFRWFWIAAGIFIGLALLWILFSYIWVANHPNNNNNNNQNNTPTNQENPSTPPTNETPTTPTQ